MSSPTSPVFPIKSINISPLTPEKKASATEQVIRTFTIDGKKFKATFTFTKKQTEPEREAAIRSLMPHIEECTKLFKIGKADKKNRTTSKLVINTEGGDKTKYTYIRMFTVEGKEAQTDYDGTSVEKRLQKISSRVLSTRTHAATSLSSHASSHTSSKSSPSAASLSDKTTDAKRIAAPAIDSTADEIHSALVKAKEPESKAPLPNPKDE